MVVGKLHVQLLLVVVYYCSYQFILLVRRCIDCKVDLAATAVREVQEKKGSGSSGGGNRSKKAVVVVAVSAAVYQKAMGSKAAWPEHFFFGAFVGPRAASVSVIQVLNQLHC